MSARNICVILIAAILAVSSACAESVSAIIRGGTVIARFSDRWIEDRNMEEVFSFSGVNLTDRVQILRDLKSSLSESEFEQFMSDYEQNSSASIDVNSLDIYEEDEEILIMSVRHIDDAVFAILRPADSKKKSFYVNCSIEKTRKTWNGFGGEYLSTPIASAQPEKVKLKISEKKVSTACNYELAGISVNVLKTEWGGVAALHAPLDLPEKVSLYIGGDEIGIPLTGYTTGEEMVYCCMLTDQEFKAMKDQAKFRLLPEQEAQKISNGPFYIAE